MIAGIVADLTADEALVLRLLLQAPLPELPESATPATARPDMAEDGDDPAARLRREDAMAQRPAVAAGDPLRGPSTTEAARATTPAAQPQGTLEDETLAGRPPVAAEDGEAPARPAAMPLPPQLPERPALPQFRDGLAVPFVPYLPAQDDLETEDRRRREPSGDEEDTSDTAGENGSDGETAGGDAGEGAEGQAADEADTPEMARRRQKIDDLVGPPDPGFAFYQKLGEYWT